MTYRDLHLTCPRCRDPLDRRTQREAWRCRICNGLAVDTATLQRLMFHIAPELVPAGAALAAEPRPSAVPRLACAACAKPMQRVSIYGVDLDRCEQDALVWFDATELDRVLDAIVHQHDAQRGWLQRLLDLLYAN